MTTRYQVPRGTQDILPEQQPYWTAVHEAIKHVTREHGFQRIDTPMFEDAAVFSKGSGDTSDIVEKEMYEFEDRGGDRLALTPEGTPAICRAYLEHGMASWRQPVRLFTTHPMFRYDRPQKGRFRQHTQFDCEVIGSEDPLTDADVITVLWRLYQRLGLTGLEVRLNSIDDPEPRREYVERLKDYYRPLYDQLSEDSKRRFERNPLRLLDSKDERDIALRDAAPKLIDSLSPEAGEHLDAVQRAIDAVGIPYRIDPLIVRGLDYYNRTVFEIVPVADERAQSTIGAGGRYDGLIETLGGPHTPGVGFGSGIERIILEMERCNAPVAPAGGVDVFVVVYGRAAQAPAFALAGGLRDRGLAVTLGDSQRSVKSQMRGANAAAASVVAIIGEDEATAGTVTVRSLAGETEQQTVPAGDAALNAIAAAIPAR